MLQRLKVRLADAGPAARIGVLATIVLVLAVVSSWIGAGDDPRAQAGRTAIAAASNPGKVVVDPRGRPLRGPDGKPLRVAKDGRTLVDSKGRPLRAPSGKPLRIRPDGTLPKAARRLIRGPGRTAERPARRTRRPRPGARPTPGASPTPSPSAGPAGDPVVVGAIYLGPGALSAAEALTGIQSTPGDPQWMLGAMRRWINAHGGIAGRPLEIRPYELGSSTPGLGSEEVCAHFGDESKAPPPAVLTGLRTRPRSILPCLSARTVLVDSWPLAQASTVFAQYPDRYFAPGGASAERAAEAYVAGLQRAGFFAKAPGFQDVRIGMFTTGGSEEATEGILKAALKRAGYSPTHARQIGSGNSSASEILTAYRRLALEFHLLGISHVVSFDAAGLGTMLFMRAAEDQGYRPRYGLNSLHAPNTIAAQVTHEDQQSGEAFRSQLRGGGGAVGVGWSPIFDVAAADDPGSGTAERCREIFRSEGVRIGDRSWFGEYLALSFCDNLLAVKAAAKRSGDVSPAGLRAGFEALGDARASALNLATWLGADRHDGASGFRLLRYVDECRCVRYHGPTFTG